MLSALMYSIEVACLHWRQRNGYYIIMYIDLLSSTYHSLFTFDKYRNSGCATLLQKPVRFQLLKNALSKLDLEYKHQRSLPFAVTRDSVIKPTLWSTHDTLIYTIKDNLTVQHNTIHYGTIQIQIQHSNLAQHNTIRHETMHTTISRYK